MARTVNKRDGGVKSKVFATWSWLVVRWWPLEQEVDVRVAILMGGRSGEHDISLVTGRSVLAGLESSGHTCETLLFHRDRGATFAGQSGAELDALRRLQAWNPDVAFIAMHGPYGEDGRVQGLLEFLEVPYQGCDARTSAVCLDKALTKLVYRDAGLPVAVDRTLQADMLDTVSFAALEAELGLPLVLKTAESGSSVGVDNNNLNIIILL